MLLKCRYDSRDWMSVILLLYIPRWGVSIWGLDVLSQMLVMLASWILMHELHVEIWARLDEKTFLAIKPVDLCWMSKMLVILARFFWWERGLGGEGRHAHIGAHSRLDHTASGHYYARFGWSGSMCTPTSTYYFFFLKARRAVMGPAKRGPIWAG